MIRKYIDKFKLFKHFNFIIWYVYSIQSLNSVCADRHIGPLCESCDYENIRGDGYFQ